MESMHATRIRTLFVSDVHLGFRHSHPVEFLKTMKLYEPENLIIVGDFIDGRRLSRSWQWNSEFDAIFAHLKQLSRNGTNIHYLPGNHDEFLRSPQNHFNEYWRITNEMEYDLAYGGQVSVLHGDIYDRTEIEKSLSSRIGCQSYELIVSFHAWINYVSKCFGMRRIDFCSFVKSWLWQASRHINVFRDKLCRHARFKNQVGVVCGHIHLPQLQFLKGTLYLNTGDWVENASYIIETETGDLGLFNHGIKVKWITRSELETSSSELLGFNKQRTNPPSSSVEKDPMNNLAESFQNQIFDYHLRSA